MLKNMPVAELTEEDLTEGSIDVISMLVKAELVTSRSEEGVPLNRAESLWTVKKITDIHHEIPKEVLAGDGVVLKRGKKKFKKFA